MNVIWKAIPGWEGTYEASSTGLIRSVPRLIVQRNRWGKVMKCWRATVVLRQTANPRGYLTVTLNREGRGKSGVRVHRLVALTFLGPCPEGMQVCHNNGDQTDNRAENLRYGTPSENVHDALKHGTFSVGAKHYKYRADIDEEEVLRLRAKGWTYRQLEDELGIGSGTIGRIIAGARLR